MTEIFSPKNDRIFLIYHDRIFLIYENIALYTNPIDIQFKFSAGYL